MIGGRVVESWARSPFEQCLARSKEEWGGGCEKRGKERMATWMATG